MSSEREDLARILDASDPEMGGVVADEGCEPWEWYLPQADAILAAGWRPPTERTDDENAALPRATISQRIAYDAAVSNRAREIVNSRQMLAAIPAERTDAEVDAAQLAYHEVAFGPGDPLSKRDLGITRQAMRAALEAADKVRLDIDAASREDG